MDLDFNFYSSYLFRSKRATGLDRALKPGWLAITRGKWRSCVWQDFHVKPDFTNTDKLSQPLGIVDNHLINSQL